MNDVLYQKYQSRFQNTPTAGEGNGCHGYLLGTASLGVMAGVPRERIIADIRQAIPPGKRKVDDREITDAVDAAFREHAGDRPPMYWNKPYHVPSVAKPKLAGVRDGKTVLSRLLSQATISTIDELIESSPVKIDWPPEEDTVRFLDVMFKPDDLLFIGERTDRGIVGRNILSAADWQRHSQDRGKTAPLIICNPLSGKSAELKNGGGATYRGDKCVSSFEKCICEFDNLTIEDQVRFWSVVKLPVAALVGSGGKSIHAWIKVSGISTLDGWQKEIKETLYDQFLTPLGVDPACSNPARLSRLPGHVRAETGKRQRLLWLASPKKEGQI